MVGAVRGAEERRPLADRKVKLSARGPGDNCGGGLPIFKGSRRMREAGVGKKGQVSFPWGYELIRRAAVPGEAYLLWGMRDRWKSEGSAFELRFAL